jgi:hypothetical protein
LLGIPQSLQENATIVLSAYQEKIPARNTIYAHAQDFVASDELLLAILKAVPPHAMEALGRRGGIAPTHS